MFLSWSLSSMAKILSRYEIEHADDLKTSVSFFWKPCISGHGHGCLDEHLEAKLIVHWDGCYVDTLCSALSLGRETDTEVLCSSLLVNALESLRQGFKKKITLSYANRMLKLSCS